MSRAWHAWVDESVSIGVDRSGFYVLAASVGDPSAAEAMRSAMRELVPKPRRRLHWHSEDEGTRREVIRRVAGLDMRHLVVVRDVAEPGRQERARRKCLERLLFELDQRRVTQVWLESRGAALDRRDLAMVAAMLGSGAVSGSLRAGFARPMEEPLLWMPDAAAGAVRRARLTGDGRALDGFGSAVEVLC